MNSTGISLDIEQATPLPPDPAATLEVHNTLRLPFDGLWWVTESPTEELGNHHQAASDQRHAYDFAIWRDGAPHAGDGADNEDYWAWGQPVLAEQTHLKRATDGR